MTLTVERIDRTTAAVPYREEIRDHMFRWLPHWKYAEIVEVELDTGDVGFGETMIYYTWGRTTDEAVERARGRNPASLMWDDSLGAGLQMALFDAVGKALSVPVHRLLGDKVHDRTPHSWWAMDMPAQDWLAECERAIEAGYTNIKVKGRPWFDLRGIVAELSDELPEWFEIDIDFNDTARDAERAIPLLRDLERHPQVHIFETPIPQEDVAGNKRIREAVESDLALHYGRPEALTAIREDILDGFILNRGASQTMEQGAVSDMAGKPLWLQLVGTGITTAFALHFGGVLDAATWPAITCHQLFVDNLLTEPFDVEEGYIPVPDDPGLGVEIDRDAIERHRVEEPDEQPDPPRLVEASWPDGRRMYFANGYQMQEYANQDEFPYFERGVSTELVPDDGSDEWQQLRERALEEPVSQES